MPTARRELALAALETALNTISAIAGLTVERDRAVAVTPADCPRLILEQGDQVLEIETDAGKIYAATPLLAGYVTAATDAALDTAINALKARALEALETDKTLGGAALALKPGEFATLLDQERGHAPLAFFETTVALRYQTAPADPYAAPS